MSPQEYYISLLIAVVIAAALALLRAFTTKTRSSKRGAFNDTFFVLMFPMGLLLIIQSMVAF